MGVVVSSKSYDTTSHFAGVTLAKDLESLPENHIVLIAVQGSTGSFTCDYLKLLYIFTVYY